MLIRGCSSMDRMNRIWGKSGRASCLRRQPLVVIAAVLLCVFGNAASDRPQTTPVVAPPQAQGYRLVFAEDFDSLDLGSKNPGPRTWYKGVWFAPESATPGGVSIDKSLLSLTWRRGQASSDTSISTLSPDMRHFKAWRYGYFEARMRWDAVRGAWPAFWLIPVQDAKAEDVYDGVKKSGELDIFEGQGDEPHAFYGTVHEWLNSRQDHASRDNRFQLPNDADVSQFHLYGALWTPGKVSWYFDNRWLHSEPAPAVFDLQDFFLVLGMQEGVDWKAGDLSGVTAPNLTLTVDWVRVWQK